MPLSASAAALAALTALAPGVALAQGHATAPAHPAASAAAGAVMPGFETLADGSTRLFVELSKPVTYETKAARGTLTYVLKGTRVLRRNNTNPLVTLHFNTPVTSAKLVPHGHDLWFVLDLRADVQPTVTMDAGKDGTAVMHIELPKGAYLPPEEEAPPVESQGSLGGSSASVAPAAAAAAPAATAPHSHRGGGSGGSGGRTHHSPD
jgi:hypothetical protein